jgi:hypothetical protein
MVREAPSWVRFNTAPNWALLEPFHERFNEDSFVNVLTDSLV